MFEVTLSYELDVNGRSLSYRNYRVHRYGGYPKSPGYSRSYPLNYPSTRVTSHVSSYPTSSYQGVAQYSVDQDDPYENQSPANSDPDPDPSDGQFMLDPRSVRSGSPKQDGAFGTYYGNRYHQDKRKAKEAFGVTSSDDNNQQKKLTLSSDNESDSLLAMFNSTIYSCRPLVNVQHNIQPSKKISKKKSQETEVRKRERQQVTPRPRLPSSGGLEREELRRPKSFRPDSEYDDFQGEENRLSEVISHEAVDLGQDDGHHGDHTDQSQRHFGLERKIPSLEDALSKLDQDDNHHHNKSPDIPDLKLVTDLFEVR
ncbi:hypothetical protein HDE_13204 [Halotydeus destructor]|nr:hypothetical protein HDE_13204 [Halotydeus destructor]